MQCNQCNNIDVRNLNHNEGFKKGYNSIFFTVDIAVYFFYCISLGKHLKVLSLSKITDNILITLFEELMSGE